MGGPLAIPLWSNPPHNAHHLAHSMDVRRLTGNINQIPTLLDGAYNPLGFGSSGSSSPISRNFCSTFLTFSLSFYIFCILYAKALHTADEPPYPAPSAQASFLLNTFFSMISFSLPYAFFTVAMSIRVSSLARFSRAGYQRIGRIQGGQDIDACFDGIAWRMMKPSWLRSAPWAGMSIIRSI